MMPTDCTDHQISTTFVLGCVFQLCLFDHVLYCMLIAPAENVCPLMEAVSTAIVSTK